MIKLLATSPTQQLVHGRLTIQASNSRAKREVCTISALPERFKAPRITHVVRGITTLYISIFI